MAPLVILIVTFGVASMMLRLVRGHWSIDLAGLVATAVLFVFTGVSHFVFPASMAEMVPPIFPAPRLWVFLTGMAEIAGSLGLLFPKTRPLAAWSLAVFLVAVFPANVFAAVNQVGMGGHVEGPGYLWFRAPLQLILLAWVVYFGILSGSRAR